MALSDLRLNLRGSGWRCKPILLSISTRGIGLNLCSLYANLVRLSKNDLPDIYAAYRAMLAIMEVKLLNLGTPERYEHIYEYNRRFRYLTDWGCFFIPEPLQRIIEAIGVIEIEDEGVYFPAMSRNTEIDGNFVPRPENILLSNLRQTVEALTDSNDSEAAAVNRKNFHLNNPIPASTWDQSHTLLNAEQIIPTEYNYDSDLKLDLKVLESFSSYCGFTVNLQRVSLKNSEGNISSLMSSEMSGLRTLDLHSEETLADYYHHAKPKNDVCNFYSIVDLSPEEVMRGATMLLGERPVIDNCPQISVYASRSKIMNPFRFGSSYQSSFLFQTKF